jgi:hypothetical protein
MKVSEALASTVPEGRYLVVQAPEPHAGQPALGAHIPRRVLLVTDDDDKKAVSLFSGHATGLHPQLIPCHD